jgi:hypothetical protein
MYLGWDVGVKNLAYCMMDKDFNIIEWNIIDLSNKKEYICCGINKNKKNCTNKALEINTETHETFCKKHTPKECCVLKPIFECFKCKQKAKKINFAKDNFYCCKHVPKEEQNDVDDVLTGKNVAKTSLNKIANILIGKLDDNPLFLKATHIAIENQPALKNPTMKSVQMILYSYFVIRLRDNNIKMHITLMSASNKLKFNIDTEEVKKIKEIKDRYKKNKKLAVEYCKYFVKDNWLEFFENFKNKKDDLADSYLMTRYYISN